MPDHQSFSLLDRRQTFGPEDSEALIKRIAGRLRAVDLGDARRFTICGANCAEYVLAIVGGLLAGASSVPASGQLTADELTYILADSGSRLLFVGPESCHAGLAAASSAGNLQVIGWRCPELPGLIPFEDWLDGTLAPIDLADRARPQFHYTSGTTGRPKGTETPPPLLAAQSSVGAMFDSLRSKAADLQGSALIVGPLNHTGPLSSVRQFAGGRALAVMDRFDAEQMLEMIAAHRIGGMVLVPTHFQRLLALPEAIRRRYDISSLSDVTHTGSRCPEDVKHAMIKWFGPVITEGYGGTEVGATNYISSAEWLLKRGSVGRTLPPFEALIIDDDDRPVTAHKEGRIYFRDHSGRGVIFPNDPEKTRSAHLQPGIFTLGDRGYLDEDGYLFITGRASDMIISGGVNIYPAEIERVLAAHGEVADVAVLGVPHGDLGEQAVAVIVARDPARPPAQETLSAYAGEHLARYKLPRSYCFVSSLGRSDMGKLNKAQLARRLKSKQAERS